MSSGKTLCIATGIFPPDTGGPAKFAHSYADWANLHNKELAFISLTDKSDSIETFSGFQSTLISRSHTFLKRFLKTVLALNQAIRSDQVVLANGLFLEVLLASYLNPRKPYFTKVPGDIVWERARNSGYTNLTIDEFQDIRLSWKWRVFRTLFTLSLRRSRRVIVPSKHLFNLCLAWGVGKEKIHLVYNSVDVDLFKPENVSKKWDVVTVCRLVPWKGVEEIIESCARLNLRLCVVGDGPQSSTLKSLAGRLGCNAEFVGNQTQTRVKELLSKSRIFVLNSNFEATAYALIEARASGLPSIARRNTGSEEVINHGVDGFLCDDELNLKSALVKLLEDPVLYDQFRTKSVEDARNRFDFEHNFESIFKVIMECT